MASLLCGSQDELFQCVVHAGFTTGSLLIKAIAGLGMLIAIDEQIFHADTAMNSTAFVSAIIIFPG